MYVAQYVTLFRYFTTYTVHYKAISNNLTCSVKKIGRHFVICLGRSNKMFPNLLKNTVRCSEIVHYRPVCIASCDMMSAIFANLCGF